MEIGERKQELSSKKTSKERDPNRRPNAGSKGRG